MYKNNQYRCPHCGKTVSYNTMPTGTCHSYTDYGPQPIVFNIHEATNRNSAFRSSLWTGTHLQLTVMCINPGEEIGPEIHYDLDQFVRIEEGTATVRFGSKKNCFDKDIAVDCNYAVIIPACTWHNIINTGCVPLKVYSIYAPPAHPFNTVEMTKAEAEAQMHPKH